MNKGMLVRSNINNKTYRIYDVFIELKDDFDNHAFYEYLNEGMTYFLVFYNNKWLWREAAEFVPVTVAEVYV